MDSTTRRVLGKRPRQSVNIEQFETDQTDPPKRSRATRHSDTNSRRPRNGLLTPEPSTLTESQISKSALTSLSEPPPLQTKDIFPFMKLPAELRLHVYHMALVRPSPIPLHVERVPTHSDDDYTHSDPTTAPFPPRRVAPRPVPTADDADLPSRLSDPVVPILLRLNHQIHKEAKQLLYSENVFELTLTSGEHTLRCLGQKTRSLIRHVVLTIPSHHDILDGFADLVRLGLRYCWGLKSFKIILQASLPDDGRVSGATSVYANAFHILRWLPRGCSVALEGCVSETVRKVVAEEGRLMNVLDEVC
jgi:hypothetical protein